MTAAIMKRLLPLNRQRWDSAQLLKSMLPYANRAAAVILAHRARYENIGMQTGVPWYIIGVKHLREANNDFRGVLHNGEKIVGTGRKTRLVPAGKGPFSTWEEAALDAIRLMGLDRVKDWSIERALYECERFNGFGYFHKGLPSPYVWSGTTVYVRGKYVRDGVFDPNAVDQQLGCAIVLKRLEQSGVQMDPPAIRSALFAPAASPAAPDDREAVSPAALPPVAPAAPETVPAALENGPLGPETAPEAFPASFPPPVAPASSPHTRTAPANPSFIPGWETLAPPQIEAIQRALFEKGYTEVGLHDGQWGLGTNAALKQFLIVNSIPEAGFVITPGFDQNIRNGRAKPVSPERATPEEQVLNERVPGRKEAWYTKVGSAFLTAFSIFSAWVASVVEDVQNIFLSFGHYISGMKPSTYLFILGGVFLVIMLIARRVQKKGDEAFIEGKVR
jgi:lysozyme family protein